MRLAEVASSRQHYLEFQQGLIELDDRFELEHVLPALGLFQVKFRRPEEAPSLVATVILSIYEPGTEARKFAVTGRNSDGHLIHREYYGDRDLQQAIKDLGWVIT